MKKFRDYIKEGYDEEEGYFIIMGGVKLYYSQDGLDFICAKSTNWAESKPFTKEELKSIRLAMDNVTDNEVSYVLEDRELIISFNETRHILMNYIELISKTDYTDL